MPSTPIHLKNSYASETPVTDGQRVYAYFGNVGVFCYDLDGKPLWSKELEPHKTRYGWGTAASPVRLPGSRVSSSTTTTRSRTCLALNARTGEELFRVERDEKSNWATPFIWKNSQRVELVTTGTNRNRSYDLEGRLLWELGGMSSITIATPYAKDDLLYISSGYVLDKAQPIFAIRPGASGDITLDKDADRATITSSGATTRPDRTTPRRSSTATCCTCCWIRASSPATTPRPAKRFTRSSGFPKARRSPRRPGPTTTRSSA